MVRIYGYLKRNRLICILALAVCSQQILLFHRKLSCLSDKRHLVARSGDANKHVTRKNVEEEANVEGRREYLIYDSDFKRGLGNCMFKMASILGIVEESDKIPVFANTSKLVKYFEHINLDSLASQPHVFNTSLRMFGGGTGKYKASMLEARTKQRNITLVGYYQSWKYFRNITHKIRHIFTFKHHIRNEAESIIQSARSRHDMNEDVILVGVHVRRGDIVNFKRLQERGFTTPPTEYYDRAMLLLEQIFRNKTLVYVVASNDYEWARSNLVTSQRRLVFLSESNSEALDMCVLSRCDHVIMSVGTFSWWAAWLAGGVTVYYDLWPKTDTWLGNNVRHSDYFLPSWIPLH